MDMRSDCIQEFDRQLRDARDRYAVGDLDGSGLAWGESYLLMGLVSMYEGTGDLGYLDTALDRFEEIQKIRDDVRGVTDEVRQRVMPGWGTPRYSQGKYHVWVVHAGMITFPMARSAYLIRRDPRLRAGYGERGDRLVRAVVETVNGFDPSWREGEDGAGWYHGDFQGGPLPLNQQNALGRSYVALWLATGDEAYRARAEKMARYLSRYLRIDGERYVWSYSPSLSGAEDISHAAINVDFAFQCYRAGIHFTEADMRRFVATLRGCAGEDGAFTSAVDGSGDAGHSPQMVRWGHLGFVDRGVRRILYGSLSGSGDSNIAGVAYLVETALPYTPDEPVRNE